MNMKYNKKINHNINISEKNLDLDIEEQDEDRNSEKLINKVQKNIQKKDITNNACKFIGSYTRKAKCPSGYRNYLGASFGTKGNSLMCNDELIESDNATAVASINNGKLQNIFITNPGSNYKSPPTVKIIGDGNNASAQAFIKKGKVVNINVINGGENFKSTPTVEISNSDGEVFCHLCCKNFN